MIRIQTLVDRKWVDQGKVYNKEAAIDFVNSYGVNQVNDFKICDCLRAIDADTEEVIISYPKDFVER